VGVRQDTLVRYSIDTYSDDIYCCLGDFMSVLQRIGDLDIQYLLSNNRLEYEPLSRWNLVNKALIKGRGILIFLTPIITIGLKYVINPEHFIYPHSDWLSTVITTLVFVVLYVLYEDRWRE